MKQPGGPVWSSVRSGGPPPIARKIWLLGTNAERLQAAGQVFQAAGHEVRTGEPGGELAPLLKDFKPDLIVIDMSENAERGRHFATQLRADRATRQLPIVLVAVPPEEAQKADRAVTGPTRRYMLPLESPSVLNAIVCDL